VLVGDRIFAWVDGTVDYEYEGFVVECGDNQITARFVHDFHARIGEYANKMNVRFEFDRIPYRRMHQSLDNCNLNVIWPERSRSSDGPQITVNRVREHCHNKNLLHNESQLNFVSTVLSRKTPGVPILLHGAFGTGKTAAIVETIILAYEQLPDTRLLVCTESNRLVGVGVGLFAYTLNLIDPPPCKTHTHSLSLSVVPSP
jgi:hypothetical protein